jgi:hypothetical protein
MTGGLMQLVAYGAQDVYLTGNPQITFFKVVYRRHTNFSIETIEQPFIGNIKFGNTVRAKITKSGDLATRMFLRLTVNKIDPEGSNFAWIRRLGHALLSKVEVQLGGTIMDRQYGTWIDIWYELARHGDHERGYNIMIGDVSPMTDYNSDVKSEYTVYVPLQFWFNRYVGLAVPLIALQYVEMFINVEFSENFLLGVYDCNFDTDKISIKDTNLLVDYIYLDTEERRRFAQVGHEYLIEQLQWNGTELAQHDIQRYQLDFNHPTKELFWVMKNGNYITGKEFLYYSNEDEWSLIDASRTIVEKSIAIGEDPTDITDGTWVEVPANTVQTVGTFNVTNDSMSDVYINPESVKIGDYGITDKIKADIFIDDSEDISIENIETELTIRDISIPVALMDDTRFNVCDPKVYQFNNYGILIDGTVNPVQYALLQLNGHDRFDRREGAYFNYVQPQQHHENTPRDGVNVYSFALYPEEHQPSGTSNLSRIDRSDLTIWFHDPTNITVLGISLPSLNLINPDNRVFIYGLNYNILRIIAGLAGLAYTIA